MQRFRRFMTDLRWSWPIAILLGLVVLAISYINSRSDHDLHRKKVQLYSSFCDECSSTDKVDPGLRHELDVIVQSNNSNERREHLNLLLNSKEEKEEYSLFFSLDKETIDSLLTNRADQIQPLINRELKILEARRINWLSILSWTWTSWKITSVLILIIFWWNEAYLISYFPYRKWWFYVYGALVYPWSLLIVFILLLSLILRGIQTLIVKFRERRANRLETYKEFCQSINSELKSTRQKWNELFSASYIPKILPDLRRRTESLCRELEVLDSDIGAKSQEYFRYKDLVSKLETKSNSLDQSDSRLLLDAWTGEFDKLIQNKHVKALRIQDSHLEIYTDVFHTLYGRFGPVLVDINLLSENEFHVISKIHESSIKGTNTGTWGETGFCFGNRRPTIHGSIKNGRINEAFSIMCDSFQSNGSL